MNVHIKTLINCLLVVSVILIYQSSYSQSPQQNFEKYWYYRYRLLNDFMKVGPGQGESIPGNKRTGSTLSWGGDETIELGWYIGVLAAEYKLLKDNNQDLSGVKEELYYAIAAFNRLDENAEYYWRGGTGNPVPQSGDLNGFFIRSDVDIDFFQNNIQHFNSIITSTINVNNFSSTFISFRGKPMEESQDQVYHLLVGFALVSFLVDPNDNYNGLAFRDGETKFVQEARNIVDRIVGYMQSTNWVLKNPVNDSCVIGFNEKADCSINGRGNATWLAYGLAEAACQITGTFNAPVGYPFTSCNKYHNTISKINFPVWYEYQFTPWCPQQGIPGICDPCQEDLKILHLAAIGNSWFYCLPTATTPILPCISPVNVAVNSTAEVLSVRGLTEGIEHVSLLHQVLYGGLNLIPSSKYVNLMNSAPCVGPYNLSTPGNANYGSYEWSASNHFMYPERKGLTGGTQDKCGDFFPGEYNGLDYMLLYNLYYIIKGAEDNLPSYINLMDRKLTGTFPFQFFGLSIGSDQIPLPVNGFNTVTAEDLVVQTTGTAPQDIGNVTLRGGTQVTIKGNTHINGNFRAYTDPFECVNGSYQKTSENQGLYDIQTYSDSIVSEIYNYSTPKYYYPPYEKPVNINQEAENDNNKPQENTISDKDFGNFPNPFHSITNITYTIMQPQPVTLTIKNILGEEVARLINNETQDAACYKKEFDATLLSAGIYFVSLQTGQTVQVHKLVKTE